MPMPTRRAAVREVGAIQHHTPLARTYTGPLPAGFAMPGGAVNLPPQAMAALRVGAASDDAPLNAELLSLVLRKYQVDPATVLSLLLNFYHVGKHGSYNAAAKLLRRHRSS